MIVSHLLGLTSCLTPLAAPGGGAGLVPFVLPWNDGNEGPTDLSFLNHVPAGRFGPIRAGNDGHFYAGDQRVRFLGVNLCFAGTIPRKNEAEGIAARMAKFGINVVRFHHMDTSPFPSGITRREAADSGELVPEALDRLDFLISELKKHGIYSNLNLLVGRRFHAGDGLPREIEELDWKERHTVGMFNARMIELQQQYARALLTHRNPYTRLTYVEDPTIAMVEINNENGIIQHYLGGDLDRLPRPFAHDLARQWNVWLRRRYPTTPELSRAWASRNEPPGREMLRPLGARTTIARPGWNLEQHEGAAGNVVLESREDGKPPVAQVTVTQTGKQGWHVQLNHAGLSVKEGDLYTLCFRARAEPPRAIEAACGQAHEPYGNLGLSASVAITPEWSEHRLTFVASATDSNARVNFSGLAKATGKIWLADTSLRPGGLQGLQPEETVEQERIPWIGRHDGRVWSRAARIDKLRFLWTLERDYWQTMQRFVKEDLRYPGVVIGTIVGCSTPNLQARFDAVDGHAYWQHPHFPNRPWDPRDWTVQNRSMVNEAGGVLAGLSMQRVEGKPFTITEYNHSAPNTFSSECPLLLAAHAAFQDWDGIFLFAYNHSGRWDTGKIDGFFDIGQHPTKMVNMLAAALMFRTGHVAPATEAVLSGLPPEREPELILQQGRAWKQVEQDALGVDPAMSLLHRTAIRAGARNREEPPSRIAPPDTRLLVSDTKEITWDRRVPNQGVVTVDTARTKAVIGFTAGRSFILGDVTLSPGRTLQDWSTICVSLIEGRSFAGPGRAIIVATGSAENTDMRWTDGTRSSVGHEWGRSPSLVEVVPARITLPLPPERLEAFALDEKGERRNRIQPRPDDRGGSTIEIGGQGTLWYELILKRDRRGRSLDR
ncbi:MAG: carbohydrate binding domain-containing protein [Phycisphaerae bacterium]|nr:carbohydrate binding domain-containing protein [Phycisphaerae bacterium]